MISHRLNQKGFTIIELIIAATVFSTVLLICTFSLMQVSRMYQKGVITARTQEVARNVLDNISQSIQFNGGAPNPGGGADHDRLCVGSRRYSYKKFQQVREGQQHALVFDTIGTCASEPPQNLDGGALASGSQELVAEGMQLLDIAIEYSGSNLWSVRVSVASGSADALEDSNADGKADRCRNETSTSTFCAVSTLTTTVEKRVD